MIRWKSKGKSLSIIKLCLLFHLIQRECKRTIGTRNLAEGRRIALDEIGFDWDPAETKWNKMLAQLVAYQNIHGHTRLPLQKPEKKNRKGWSKELALWEKRQRYPSQGPEEGTERWKKLNDIGFFTD